MLFIAVYRYFFETLIFVCDYQKRDWAFSKAVHCTRSRNNSRVFESGDHLLVNGKFETGFLNPGRTVIDPLTDRTLPNAFSQPSRVRLRKHEVRNKKRSHLRTVRRARSILSTQFRILAFNAYLFPGYDQGRRVSISLNSKVIICIFSSSFHSLLFALSFQFPYFVSSSFQ